jgi:hypothetical protein
LAQAIARGARILPIISTSSGHEAIMKLTNMPEGGRGLVMNSDNHGTGRIWYGKCTDASGGRRSVARRRICPRLSRRPLVLEGPRYLVVREELRER